MVTVITSTVNLWKSYMWTADKDVNMKAIFAVIMFTTWAVLKIRREKNLGLYANWTNDLCDTGEVLYQGVDHYVGSEKTREVIHHFTGYPVQP